MKKYIEDLKTALLCCSSELCGGEHCPYYTSNSCHKEFINNTLSLIAEHEELKKKYTEDTK